MKREEDWMHLQKPKSRAAVLCLDQCSLCFDQGEAGRLGSLVPVAECHPSNPSLPCRFLEALCTIVLLHLSLPRISLRVDYKWANLT